MEEQIPSCENEELVIDQNNVLQTEQSIGYGIEQNVEATNDNALPLIDENVEFHVEDPTVPIVVQSVKPSVHMNFESHWDETTSF